MRANRQSGLEGGLRLIPHHYPYRRTDRLSAWGIQKEGAAGRHLAPHVFAAAESGPAARAPAFGALTAMTIFSDQRSFTRPENV
jgi:hypothetical protein